TDRPRTRAPLHAPARWRWHGRCRWSAPASVRLRQRSRTCLRLVWSSCLPWSGAQLEDALDLRRLLAGEAQGLERPSLLEEITPEHRAAQRDQAVYHWSGHSNGIAERSHRDQAARHVLGDVLVIHRFWRGRPLIRAGLLVRQATEALGEVVAAEAVGVEEPAMDAR